MGPGEARKSDQPSDRSQEIDFLLSCLVDTEGPESRQVVLERLLELMPVGHHPSLYVESVSDPRSRAVLRDRYQRFLNELKLRHDLKKLMEAGPAGELDLELGSFLISRLGEEQSITPEDFAAELDRIAMPLRNLLNIIPDHEYEERIGAFRRYLFSEKGFRGNTENYYDPRNSFLTQVLESRSGIPVSLSVLCLLVARRVGLPLQGVNLPGHFILKYQAGDYLIYMDPFNDGNLLTEEDCLNFLVRQGLEPTVVYLARASSLTILKRMYRNLINYHSAIGNVRMEKILRQHFSILENHSIRS
jgi:regulator of sirC expression with transglutaminase-like and TPR domain